jgi:hypothetical protein
MRKVLAIMKLNSNTDKRYPHIWFQIFVFPFLMIGPMALLMRYLGMGMAEVSFVMIGLIVWRFVYLSQVGISFGLLVPVWTRTIRDYESCPIRDWEYITGMWLYWLGISALVVLYLSLFAWLLIGFNMLEAGFMIIPIFLVFGLMGIPLGLITLSVVYTLGIKSDIIAWSMTDVIIFLSGVFYPVIIFPEWVQVASYSLPSTWGLIAARSLFTGSFDWLAFQMFIVLTIVFTAAMYAVFLKSKRRALSKGFMQKYM